MEVVETKPRTLADVQQEYANTCAAIGEMQYKMSMLAGDMKTHIDRVAALQKEGAEISSREAKSE